MNNSAINELLQNIYQLNEHFNITNIEDCQMLLYMIYNNIFNLNNSSPEINNAINNILITIEEQLLNANLLHTPQNDDFQQQNDCFPCNEDCPPPNNDFYQNNQLPEYENNTFLKSFLPYSILKIIEHKNRFNPQFRRG